MVHVLFLGLPLRLILRNSRSSWCSLCPQSIDVNTHSWRMSGCLPSRAGLQPTATPLLGPDSSSLWWQGQQQVGKWPGHSHLATGRDFRGLEPELSGLAPLKARLAQSSRPWVRAHRFSGTRRAKPVATAWTRATFRKSWDLRGTINRTSGNLRGREGSECLRAC